MAIYVLSWGRPLVCLVDVRHQAKVFVLRFLGKIATLKLDGYARNLLHSRFRWPLQVRHGGVNTAPWPTDKSAGSDGACK